MHLIVGIDPGTTTGIAAVTLDGNVRHIRSSRNMGVNQIVKHITSLGRASLIASDVTPTPDSVLKIASSLGCVIFTLYEPLSVTEKNNLTSGYDVEGLHARDALAAALNAYNKYKNKLNKITALGYGDEVKHRVLQGNPLERVVQDMEAEKNAREKKKKTKTQSTPLTPLQNNHLLKQNNQLREEIKLKDFEITQLRREINALKTRPKAHEHKNARMRQQEQVIDSLEYKIKKLETRLKDIDRTTSLWKQQASGKITPVGIYPEIYAGLTTVKYRLSSEDLEKLKDTRLVYTDDPKNRETLSAHGIPTAQTKHVTREGDIAYTPTHELNRILHSTVKSIENIVDEYRRERKRTTQ